MAIYRNTNTIHLSAAQAKTTVWTGPGRVARVILTNANAAGAEIYLYDTIGDANTAAKTIFHGQLDIIGAEAGYTISLEAGAKFATGLTVVLTGTTTKATIVLES